jgi:hypothetical protein
MKTIISNLYEVKLYLGSVERGEVSVIRHWGKESLVSEIGLFQKNHEIVVPVRITNTTFVCDNYTENGWEVAAISYPRTNHSYEQTKSFMLSLGEHLLHIFGQSRICVLSDCGGWKSKVYMLENNDDN